MAKKSGKSVSPLVTGKKLPFAAPVPFMTMLLEPNFGKDVTINMVPLTTAYGLSVLADVDKLYIHPVDTFPFKTDMKLTRRYKILNGTSQFVMAAGEFIDFGSNCWRGMQRRYCIYYFTTEGDLAFTSERQRLRCCSSKAPKQEAVSASVCNTAWVDFSIAKVRLCTGELIGTLRDVSSPATAQLCIDDSKDENIFKISGRPGGNICPPLANQNSSFKLFDAHQGAVGDFHRSLKIRDSASQEVNCFGASFSRSLTPVTKALVISAAFDLNISYFQRKCSCDFYIYVLIYVWILAFVGGSITLLLWVIEILKF